MSLWPILTNALIFGCILSAILFTMVLLLVRINPEIMLGDYPPDIQAKYGPMSQRTRRQRIPVALLILAVMFAIVAASFAPILSGVHGPRTFLVSFVNLSVMFTVFNVLDWLVLDWLIVVTLRPKFLILPGTEGMAGYGDYAFHFRGFLIGIAITLAASILLSGFITILF